MSKGGFETEMKLRMTREELARLKASPWWASLDEGGSKALKSTYFDTKKRSLRRHGVSLRTRNKGDVTEQTVKLSGAAGAFQRREWTAAIFDSFPDPTLVIDPSLPKAFRKLTAADLKAIFTIDVERDVKRLDAPTHSVEIAADTGAIARGNRRRELIELELELTAGEPQQLIDEARRVIDVAGGRLHLTSKADQGFALLDPKAKPYAKATPLEVDSQADVATLMRAALMQCLGHLTLNDECAAAALHEEGVHQARVALRRLRSAIQVFRKALPREPFQRLEGQVKWLAKSLGAARDLDVLQAELIDPARAALADGDDVTPLLKRLKRAQSAAHAQVAKTLASPRYARFLVDLLEAAISDDWLTDDAPVTRPAAPAAAAALSKAHARTLKQGKGFKKLSIEERHALRIRIKRLRYGSEISSGLFDARKTAAFAKSLAGLQEGLGRLNDVAVAERLLTNLTREPAGESGEASDQELSYAVGCVLGWHRRRAAVANERLAKDWKAFAKAKPFWA